MEIKNYELLSILNYSIPENLFKEKIGTGEELRELLKEGILAECSPGYYQVNFDSDKIISIHDEVDKKELHQEMIETYYLESIKSEINSDYPMFIDKYLDYINISYHYRELGDFDNAIENIFYIAKKLVFWGFGDELIKELDRYDPDQLNEINHLWKQYYMSFYRLIHPSGRIEEIEFFNFINSIEQQDVPEKHILYLETKNLEGIYHKDVKNDVDKAIGIFEQSVQYFESIGNNSCKDVKLAYARILENLALCKNDNNVKELDEYFHKAQGIFKEYDEYYELSKLYLFKLSLLTNASEVNMVHVIQEHSNLSGILEEYAFPDVERNLFNLLSNVSFMDSKNLEEYMEIKIEALTRDLVLYFDNFMSDLIDILHMIEKVWQTQNSKIEKSIDLLLEFLAEVGLTDELYFIKGIKACLLKEDTDKEFKNIKNESLKEFAYEYVGGLD